MKNLTALNKLSVAAAGTVFLTLGMLTTGTARAVQLITNGGFETGDFTGWNVSIQPGSGSLPGSFFIDDADGFTPVSGQPTVGPASGSFYAVTDQDNPGAYALKEKYF